MKLGVDLSIQNELEKYSPHYYYQGKEIDPFYLFGKVTGVESVRLRVWNHPYDEEGRPYGGGTNDVDTLLRLAKRAKDNGMSVLVDFHYSDFWVDPSRQKLPKEWSNLSTLNEICAALYNFTKETLLKLKEENIHVSAVQVGNEITHGMVWPYGDNEIEYDPIKGGGFKGLARLLKAGIKAVKEVYPEAKTVLHLEHSGTLDMQDWYWSNIFKEGVEFDVMGESYYPYWHGPFSMFEDCIQKLKAKYHKEVWVVELGYQFVPDRAPKDNSMVTDIKEDDFVVGNVNGRIPFAHTKEGQAEYLKTILAICHKIGIGYVYYWEPTWLRIGSHGWATDEGQKYCGLVPTVATNEWADEILFDENGNANPGLDVFSKKYIDSLK